MQFSIYTYFDTTPCLACLLRMFDFPLTWNIQLLKANTNEKLEKRRKSTTRPFGVNLLHTALKPPHSVLAPHLTHRIEGEKVSERLFVPSNHATKNFNPWRVGKRARTTRTFHADDGNPASSFTFSSTKMQRFGRYIPSTLVITISTYWNGTKCCLVA